ncbi:MAG: hypothetical protein RAP70_03890 [Candidatus Celaenobacter antarcticus]|nr:hypothetical protein [Candidatus Celaenobacter antarcticus]MDP8314199.1 hypothetical protein [Candidatus Celaenobacter antarcticus]
MNSKKLTIYFGIAVVIVILIFGYFVLTDKTIEVEIDIEDTLSVSDSVEEKASDRIALIDALKVESLSKIWWELSIGYESKDSPLKNKNDLSNDLDLWLQNKPDGESHIENVKEYDLVLQYQNELKNLLKKFGFIGGSKSYFIYLDNQIPVRFITFNGKQLLIITNIATVNIYNTLSTNAKSRAALVITSCVLPSLLSFNISLKDTKIEYYGVIVYYGSKNFVVDTNVNNLLPEALCFIVSKENCLRFLNLEITESELLNRSYIFISDRDMPIGFKKIELDVE